MPNGHDYSKEYGGHKYADHDGTSDCKHGCGCSMGPSMSHGPTGLDPFGECPGNPIDGKKVGGKADYDIVVTRRIQKLESRAYNAEEALKKVDPEKIELAEKLAAAQTELAEAKKKIKSALKIFDLS